MPELKLKVVTYDEGLANELRGFTEGVDIPGGAILRYKGERIQEALGEELPAVLFLVLQFGAGVAASLVANWLADKFRGRVKRMVVGNKVFQEIKESETNEIRVIVEMHREKVDKSKEPPQQAAGH